MKTAIKKYSILALLVGLSGTGQAAAVYTYNTPLDISDGEPAGKSVNFDLSGAGLGSAITDMTVSLNISGTGGQGFGYTGDLYVYLKNNDANGGAGVTSVLLNRVGDGNYGNDGFNVTFSMASTPDIHTYQDSNPVYVNDQLTGTWAADGRVNPGAGQTGDPRPAKLNVFQGVNPNANWTLFLADYAGGSVSTLNSFSVDMVAVPEPAQTAMACAGMLLGLVLYRRPQIREKLASLIRR